MKLSAHSKAHVSIVLFLQAAAIAPPPAPTDAGWPRQITEDSSTLVYYQSRVDEWQDYKTLIARVGFSLTAQGGKQTLGVASFRAATFLDEDTRTVYRTTTVQKAIAYSGAGGSVVKADNNVYAGHDGNVYRKNSTGSWSQYNNGNWDQVSRPSSTTQSLNSAAQSRQRGQFQTQRTRSFSRGGFRR